MSRYYDKKRNSAKPKRSTHKGDAKAKLIAALTAYHKYADDGALNQEPIGNNALAKLAGETSPSTASNFFKKQFGGHKNYEAACRRDFNGCVLPVLKSLNGDYSMKDTYGKSPPGEQERDG